MVGRTLAALPGNVDYNNRLPRDASYARHGHVLSVKINGNEMQAKVKGSRATPYRVVHFDLWWNPAVENQATYRAYRIGQKKNVMV